MVEATIQLTFSQENDLLNLLQLTAQELTEVFRPEKAGEKKGADQICNGHRDSAGIPARLFHFLGTFCALHTDRMCVLREVLCATANTLTEPRMCSNLACKHPYRESREPTTNVGKCFMKWLFFYKSEFSSSIK